MRSLRFIHVFTILMIVAAACAFAIPARVTDKSRENVKLLFYPVARPAGWLGRMVFRERPRDDGAPDPNHPRDVAKLIRENQDLKVQVQNLLGRMQKLEELDKVLASVGDVRELCDRFKTIGPTADMAGHEALHITGSTGDGIKPGMAVLYGGMNGSGIAGVIERAQLGGSTVQLTTAKGFRVTVGFARFVERDGRLEFVVIATPKVLAEGDGRGAMWIDKLSMQDAKAADVRAGDWVVLSDDSWSDLLQRYRIGRVTSVAPSSKNPLFAEIKAEPGTNLLKLDEVMVMVKAR